MSDDHYHHALYFDKSLSSEFDKNVAISSLVGFLNNYHWGPAPHVVCGCAKTESDEPVILGTLLTGEVMKAKSLGFNVVPIKPEIL